MSVYALVVFLHIVGALGLFAALGLEWAGLFNLRRVATAGQAREWTKLLTSLRFVGGPSLLTILATGIYLMATRWGEQGWIGAGLGGLVLIGALGGALTGRRVGVLARTVAGEEGGISAGLRQRLHDPVLLLSLWLRTALALGIVFVMSIKPGAGGAAGTMGVALVLGLAAAFPVLTRGRRTVPAP
jgi:hypothetical protein